MANYHGNPQNICNKTAAMALKHNPNDTVAQQYAAQCKAAAPAGNAKAWACAHYLVGKGDSMSTAVQNCKISNS